VGIDFVFTHAENFGVTPIARWELQATNILIDDTE
jgi:hypothetical protein